MKRALLILVSLSVLVFVQEPGLFPSTVDDPPVAEANTTLPSASGALSPVPPNFDFNAGEPIVSAPSNYGFEDGLTNWDVQSGSASAESGGYEGDYLEISGNGSLNPKVVSDAFVVDSEAPFFSYYVKSFGGFTMYRLEVAPEPSYSSWSPRSTRSAARRRSRTMPTRASRRGPTRGIL